MPGQSVAAIQILPNRPLYVLSPSIGFAEHKGENLENKRKLREGEQVSEGG
jgi:hypothetical protein